MSRRQRGADPVAVDYGPKLVEAAVRAALEGECGTVGPGRLLRLRLDHRLRLDALYRLPCGLQREAAFRAHYRRLFDRLGFDRRLPEWLALFPDLRAALARIVVRSAAGHRREGVELHEDRRRGSRGVAPYLLIELLPTRFARPRELAALVLPRLVMAADALDPDLGFGDEALAGASPFGNGRRKLVRRLWELSARARLDASGTLPDTSLAGEVDELFSVAGSAGGERRSREVPAWLGEPGGRRLEDLQALAAQLLAARDQAAGERDGRVPGARCALCRFPTHAWAEAGSLEEVAAVIGTDFPDWTPEAGCCAHCADRYLSVRRARAEG